MTVSNNIYVLMLFNFEFLLIYEINITIAKINNLSYIPDN